MRSVVALAVLVLFACGSEEPEAPATEAPEQEEAPATVVPTDPSSIPPNPGAAPGAPGTTPGAPGAEGAPPNPMAVLGAAIAAAGNAEGDTPCEQSFNGLVAMFEAMPRGGTREGTLPDREAFLAACADLPEETQRCVNPGYGMQHPECQAVLQTPEALAFRDSLRPGPSQ